MLKLIPIFTAIFIAELGDKTQIATLLFATDRGIHPLLVFTAAATALTLSAGLAVLVGSYGSSYLAGVPMKLFAGAGFMAIGVWFIAEHFLGK
jgi:putative Ca2+/H+ antiporter (TMEM165/GDT1 family)